MKKIACFALAGLLALASCSDFLDADNKSNVTSDDYFNTPAGFETLVNYAYAQLKVLYGGSPAIFSSGTDLYHRGRNAQSDAGLQNYTGLNPENSTVAAFYTDCYEGIQAANCVLHYAKTTEGTEATIAKRVAEARFIKALYYFELVQHFGGVPLVKDYVKSIVNNVPRATLENTYAYIFEELNALTGAASPLPAVDKSGRISKQAVYHYLAKAYLTAGWDLNVSAHFTTAAAWADSAIALGTGLDETFESLWWPANDNNHQEVVLAIQYDSTSSIAAGLAKADYGNSWQTNFCQYLGGNDQGYKGTSSNFLPSERLMNLFQPGDTRYEATFMTTLYCKDPSKPKTTGDYYAPYKGTTPSRYVAFYYPPHYASSPADIAAWKAADTLYRATTVVIPMASTTIHPNGAACTYYEACTEGDAVFGIAAVRKFDDPESIYGNNTCYRDIVLARLGETYLIAAEAYLKAGVQGTADDRLNVVRERAFRGSGLAYTKNNVTIDDILEERALELCAERLRWTDLRRTQKLINYNVLYNPELTDASSFIGNDGKNKIYRPIPQSAIDLNTATIEQNEGFGSAPAQ